MTMSDIVLYIPIYYLTKVKCKHMCDRFINKQQQNLHHVQR